MLDAVRRGLHVQQVVQHERLAAWLRGRRPLTVADVIGKMINTTLSCVPPIVQLAGTAALKRDKKERDEVMVKFREKVVLLTEGLNRIEGFRTLDPTATFYVFPNVALVCNKLGVTSHGLALYLLQGADDKFGIACLGASVSARPAPDSCASAAPSRTTGCSKRSSSFRRPSRAPTGSRRGSTTTRGTGSRALTPSSSARKLDAVHFKLCQACDAHHRSSRS